MLRNVMLILGLLSSVVLVQAQEKKKPVLLSDNGLPAKAIESVLPTGPVAHLRLNNLGKTINDSEAFALTLLPKEIIPPDLAKVFEKPNPLLTLVGMKTLGEAIGASSIATATGIDITRPLTATLYPRKKDPLVIVKVDLVPLELGPERFEKTVGDPDPRLVGIPNEVQTTGTLLPHSHQKLRY